MAKQASQDFFDGALNVIKNSVTRMIACSAQPTTYAEANTTYNLAQVTMASTDFTLAAGVTSGRRVTVAAKSGVSVTASATANHVALVDVTNSKLLYVTTAANQALTSGSTVSFGAWDIEIAAAA